MPHTSPYKSYEIEHLIDKKSINADEEEAPKDAFGLVFMSFVLLGSGFLFPWDAVITAIDYWVLFYDPQIIFNFTVAYMCPNLIGLIFVVNFGPKIPMGFRLVGGFISFIVIVMILVFSRSAWLAVGLCAGLGFTDAVVQGSVYGLAGQFHPKYVGAVMSGNGVAGTIIAALRIITKLIIPDDAIQSGMSYFITACAALVLCIVAYLVVIRRSAVTQYYLDKVSRDEVANKKLTGEENVRSSLWEIFKNVWQEALMVALNFWITLALFPGITSQMTSTNESLNKGQWFPIILFMLFNFFDLVGRTLPRWESFILCNRKTLWIPSILRLAFFPLFLLSLRPKVFVNDMWMYVFMSLMGCSNGYIGTLCMMFAPDRVQNKDKEVTGTLMVFFLTTGLTAGVWTGTLFEYLVTNGYL